MRLANTFLQLHSVTLVLIPRDTQKNRKKISFIYLKPFKLSASQLTARRTVCDDSEFPLSETKNLTRGLSENTGH